MSVELFKSGEDHFNKHIPKIFDIIDQISWDCRTLQSGEDHFEERFEWSFVINLLENRKISFVSQTIVVDFFGFDKIWDKEIRKISFVG